MKNLLDINWTHLGKTDEYKGLKACVAGTCRDVTRAGQIDEVCINDILHAFRKHGYIVVDERHAASVLMSRHNPEGWKLENLADQLRGEVEAKTRAVSHDQSFEAKTVVNNNAQIIGLLYQIEALQRQSFAVMATIRPDEGPTGEPRIGQRK